MADIDDIIPPQYIFGPRYRSSVVRSEAEPSQQSETQIQKEQSVMDPELRQKYKDNPYYDELNSQHYLQIEEDRILFLSGKKNVQNPRKQSYASMLRSVCCPVWKLVSLSTACLIIYLGVFIAEAAVGLNKEGTLLQIDLNTLVKFGANSPLLVRNGEVWRLIVAAVLHLDFNHLLGNAVSTIILLSHIEYTIGVIRSIILYVLSAIGGNIFSAVCEFNSTKAGASTSLFGGVGLTIGYFIYNWKGLDRIGPIMKCQLGCVTFMIVVFTAAFTSVGENVDYFGHLGGFLTGVWCTAITRPLREGKRQRIIRGIFIFLFILQFAITFTIFYTMQIPNQ